jgi:hypothetical protein
MAGYSSSSCDSTYVDWNCTAVAAPDWSTDIPIYSHGISAYSDSNRHIHAYTNGSAGANPDIQSNIYGNPNPHEHSDTYEHPNTYTDCHTAFEAWPDAGSHNACLPAARADWSGYSRLHRGP